MITVEGLERLSALLDRMSADPIQVEISVDPIVSLQISDGIDVGPQASCNEYGSSDLRSASPTSFSQQLVQPGQSAGSGTVRLLAQNADLPEYPSRTIDAAAIAEGEPGITEQIKKTIQKALSGAGL
jgi:hypothetical protein